MNRTFRLLIVAAISAALVLTGVLGSAHAPTAGAKGYTIAIVTKSEAISVFQDVDTGAGVAAKELGDTFIHTGPATTDAAKQRDIIVNSLIPRHPSAIGASANDPNVVGAALAQAKAKGIKTFSWDSDVVPADRSIFVNQAPTAAVGALLAKMACHDAPGCKGQIAILSATPTSTNQNAWIAAMKTALHTAPKYSKLRLVTTVYGNDLPDKSTTEAQGLVRGFPKLKVIVAPTSVGIVAAAKVVQDSHLRGKVDVTGLCFAKDMVSYIRNGVTKQCALWSFKDLGYLAEYVGHDLAAGMLTGAPGQSFSAGKLGTRTVGAGGVVVLGPLQQYNKFNVGYYLTHGSKCCG